MMRDTDHFAALLPTSPVRELGATMARRVPLLAMVETNPLDFLFMSGRALRCNPRGIGCVYFAEDEATAAVEYARHRRRPQQPFATYFAEVRLQCALDLCEAGTLSALGLDVRDLRAPWVGARKPTALQSLGDAVSRQTRIAAIRFPSEAARLKGFAGANVVILRDCVRRPDHLHILGPTRKPLQKWPR